MDDIAVIDTFLKYLYDKGNKGACIVDVVSVDKSQRDRIETTLTGKSLVEELKSYVAGKRKFKLSDIGIDIVSNYKSYSDYLEEQNKSQQSRTTNIQAENVQYTEGSVHGDQTQSSSDIKKYITEATTAKKIGMSIMLGIVVWLITQFLLLPLLG